MSSKLKLGLYCHVPFCAHRCDYCAFYQEPPTRQQLQLYLAALAKEYALVLPHVPFDTLYVGGGTPSLLPPSDLERFCQIVTQNNRQQPLEEFSFECSPQTITSEKLEILARYGCNRITIGVQSFQPEILKILGRRQSPDVIFRAYDIARRSPITNIGLDLMFNIPNQTLEDWQNDLRIVTQLAPEHLSTYSLILEEHTPLASRSFQEKSEREATDFYLYTWDFLQHAGYEHYEISNFCRPGKQSLHNTATWQMQEWIGIGPSACSQYQQKRYQNISSLEKWADGIFQDSPQYIHEIVLTDEILATDAMIFGFRMPQGIHLGHLQQRFPSVDFSRWNGLWEQLIKEHFLIKDGPCLALTPQGLLVEDAISLALLDY